MLQAREADQHAEVPAVARRMLHWGARHRLATGLGMRRAAFVRQQLDRLGIGAELETLTYNGEVLQLGPSCRRQVEPTLGAAGAAPLAMIG